MSADERNVRDENQSLLTFSNKKTVTGALSCSFISFVRIISYPQLRELRKLRTFIVLHYVSQFKHQDTMCICYKALHNFVKSANLN